MNSSEKRRKELLERTRMMYSDRREPPAVHPRFGSGYGRLYDGEEETPPVGTFGMRLFLCLLLFAAFVAMEKQEYEIFHMDSAQIAEEIGRDFNVKESVREVWNNL